MDHTWVQIISFIPGYFFSGHIPLRFSVISELIYLFEADLKWSTYSFVKTAGNTPGTAGGRDRTLAVKSKKNAQFFS